MQSYLRGAGATLLVLALAAGLPLAARAQAPEPRTVGAVTYVGGGIGDGEVAALREQAASYSAMIEFVEIEPGSQHGAWTADVVVDVKSGTQVLASIIVPGPLLLLRLAPGRYNIDATHGDVRLSKVLDIKPRGALLRERFIWRAAAGSLGGDLRDETPAKR